MDRNRNPLQDLFEEVVAECYHSGTELDDAEVTSYVAGVLADFSETEHLYRIHNAQGRPLRDVTDMLIASDPVYGDAYSFEREREVRKHIGDFSLFFAGMFPESATWRHRNHQDGLRALIRAGKESYYIVSQFNVFEFEQEAPLFGRLAENFEACAYGLGLVRKELEKRRVLPAAPSEPPLLM
jgi:hypothetical protein